MLTLSVTIALAAGHARAQLAAPNAAGVSMGHLHYQVKDVEANTRFWTALGGTAITIGRQQAISFPDVIVVLERGEYSGNSEGAVLNHVAFRVRTFAQVEAAGVKVDRLAQFPGVGYTYTPERERVEVFEDAALNLTFTPDAGPAQGIVARHNAPLATPVAFHHVHLYLPGEAHLEAKAWYARMFGGVPGKRSQYDAVDLPGINFNFSGGRSAGPMKGRTLAHLGLEVRGCRRSARASNRWASGSTSRSRKARTVSHRPCSRIRGARPSSSPRACVRSSDTRFRVAASDDFASHGTTCALRAIPAAGSARRRGRPGCPPPLRDRRSRSCGA